ncbi:tigger transposable element-derived protein 6-like [Dermacentor silvarum]|uniref:tigger transposable element-derived protein 6-like n=1 Tax=Dermacentor silvarum TaxID=543639 RepID=UPI002100807A|nr:tigger transposable element-derived protein 6-like [Dermacentor silvarum]
MTAEIFQAWLRQLDRRFAAKAQKVLFVLDNCSAHTKVSGLENIELLFLPPNTTASLHPMDQGIIQFVKSRYRRQVLERMLLCIEAGKQCEVSLLSAIHVLTYVWKNTPPEVVANCFRHSCFVHDAADTDVVADVESDEEQDGRYVNIMPADVPLRDYFAIDNDVAAAGIVTDSDIVAKVMDGEGESADEDPNDSDERPRPTMTEAAHALTVLEDICMVSSDSLRRLSFTGTSQNYDFLTHFLREANRYHKLL